MQINARGALYRFAYWPVRPESRPRFRVSVCTLAARLFISTFTAIGAAALFSVSLFMVFFVGYMLYTAVSLTYLMVTDSEIGPRVLYGAGIIAAGVVVVAGLVTSFLFFSASESGQLFRLYVRSKKERLCPMIEIV